MSVIISGTDGVSDVDGSASTPAIRGTDANTGIFFGSDIIGFSEGGTECARFNADAQFVAAAGTASLPVLTTTGDLNTGIFFPAADNIGFATNGVIRGRWTTDGLCFNADTAAANALDDYEEGTWTPTVGGNATYTAQAGHYTKIGNFVKLRFHLQINTLGTGSTTTISGLPFSASSNDPTIMGGVVTYANTLAVAASYLGIYAQGSVIYFFSRNTSVTTATTQQPTVIGNSFDVYAEVSYMV